MNTYTEKIRLWVHDIKIGTDKNIVIDGLPVLRITLKDIEYAVGEFITDNQISNVGFDQILSDIFDALNKDTLAAGIYETCFCMRIEGEYSSPNGGNFKDILKRFISLEQLELDYIKFCGLRCVDMPISLRYLDINGHGVNVDANEGLGVNYLKNLETLIIDEYATYGYILDLPKLKILLIMAMKSNPETPFISKVKNNPHIYIDWGTK